MKYLICGLWHVHAPGYYETAAKYGEIVGVYEENEQWRKEFCEAHNLKEFATLDEALHSGADAAIVCVASNVHAETMIALANAKMDIFTEKVLALSSAECDAIEEAVEKNGVRFVISYPHKYSAGAQTVKQVVDSGELGKINYFRCRNAHDGSTRNWLPLHFYDAKECGGGAMIDLGAHGMYLSEWICGMPITAKSVFTVACSNPDALAKNKDSVEDNAVTVLQYANGCIGLNETGFNTAGYPITLEVAGENGRVIYTDGVVKKWTREEPELKEIPMAAELPSPLDQFCRNEILPGCGMAEAKKLTRLMEVAYAGK